MIRLITFLMKQRLFINLLVLLILFGGIMAGSRLNREAYPNVNFDMVSIQTIYPGGSPDEIEQLISIPIEKKLREVDGLDKVRTYNIENVSVVVAYIDDKAKNKKKVVQDIKDSVELVENLPRNAQLPIVEEITLDTSPAIDIAIYANKNDVSYKDIRDTADILEDFLYEIEGVAEVEDFGYLDREYLVEVDPDALKKYDVGINTILQKLSGRNVDYPGGTILVNDTEYVLRTKGQYKNTKEIGDTVILANDNAFATGFVTRIRNIAKVSDTFEEADVIERFNGQNAIIFRVWRQRSIDEIRLVDTLRAQLEKFHGPTEDVSFAVFNDTSRVTRDRIGAVLTNASFGFVLLALVLVLLLGFRMSAIVTISIPVSFMIAVIGMSIGNITFNVISLFGMIMVLGMIVDFSIVVAENSHRYMEEGHDRFEAIKKGISEIFWPLTVTLICISAAFAPLLFLSGILGKFIIGIPIVLIICLTASWFIAQFILPTYLNIFAKEPKEIEIIEKKPGLFDKIQEKYRTVLEVILKYRYGTVGILFLLLLGSLTLVATGLIKFEFMPGGGEEQILIRTTMPQDTNLQANLREMEKIENIIMELPKKELEAVHVTVGEETTDFLDPKPGQATNRSTIDIMLTLESERNRNAHEILDNLRKKIQKAQKDGSLLKNIDLYYEAVQNGPPIGKPVNVEIRGKDFSVLKKIADEYIVYLDKINGVRDIRLDLEEGKKEYRFHIDEVNAAVTGVSAFDIGQALNASFDGAVATSIMKGKEEINIKVRYPLWARKRISSLNDVMIANQQGRLIPLNKVTSIKKQNGYTKINRLNYKRIVQVQADVDTKVISSIIVNTKLVKHFNDIEERYPGYSVAYGGEQEDTNESMGELGELFILALLFIYIVLAVFFESLILPIVVMIAIPFSLIGVIFALGIHFEPMSFMGTLGIFSLAGVIVSNTLVLVQFIDYKRDEGLSLKDALVEAGAIRLRPVLLTTGTTVLGLFPTIYGLGGVDYFVAPLALSFGYGLIFATFITLVLIPSFYHIAEDIKGLTAVLVNRVFGVTINGTLYKPGERDYKVECD